MTRPAMQLIEALAARQSISLPIGWDEKLSEDLSVQDPDFVERLCGQLG